MRWIGFALLLTAAACQEQAEVVELPPLQFGPPEHQEPIETAIDLKVAFLGDHGVGAEAEAVLRLIKAEGTDLVLSQGDLGYGESILGFGGNADEFERMVTRILGPDFPFFASLGNHDRDDWRRYHQLLRERVLRVDNAKCEGIVGVEAACLFKGLFFITSAAEVLPDQPAIDHAAYMTDKLARSPARWRICSWHYDQRAMQLGDKKDKVGWEIYEACRKGGAIIATAHEHSYARTHLIGKFADRPEVAATGDTLAIEPGKTIAFVSGLGGKSVRPQLRGGDWWASVFTASQGARPGALFCTFNPKGQRDHAVCYFKTIAGEVPDRFELTAATPLLGNKISTAVSGR